MKVLDSIRKMKTKEKENAASGEDTRIKAQTIWTKAIEEAGVIGHEEALSLGITRKAIRRVMDRSGWSAYEAFCNMCEISQKTGKPFRDIVSENLWREYKYEQASMMMKALPTAAGATPIMPEVMFRNIFYTPKQRKAIDQIKKGSITAKTLCGFFNIEMPDEFMCIEGDLTNKLAFQISKAHNGKIFFCAPEKYVVKDLLMRVQPGVIIGYPMYRKTVEAAGIPFVSCPMVGSYILDLAKIIREKERAKVVAITGSVGKTTTTGMIGRVVGDRKKIHMVHGNQNTTWQVADFIMSLDPSHEVFIQECSGSFPSQLEKTSKAVEPDVFVLTNIGNGHIGRYDGKQERLLYEKTALDRHAADGAIGIVNWDDPLLKSITYQHRIKGFSVKDNSADYHAENVETGDGKIHFDVVEKDGLRTPVTLNVLGTHNVYNALAAFAVGRELDIERSDIVESLESFETEGARQNLVTYGGRKLYIDCLSATEESMRSAVQTAGTIDIEPGSRRFMVLADVTALGDRAEEVHRHIGTMVSEIGKVDQVFFYWDKMRFAYEVAKNAGVECRFTDKKEELEKWLEKETKPGDLIAIKAGHATGCLSIVDDLYGTGMFVHDKFSMQEPVVNNDGMKYKCIGDNEGIGYYGAALIKADRSKSMIDIPAEVEGNPVRFIDTNVFAGSKVQKIILPDTVKGIGSGAFKGCRELVEVKLPKGLKYIGPHAFSGCISLKEVDLSGGCSTIDDAAFEKCVCLERVILPESIQTVRNDAINGSVDIQYV